MLLPTLPIQLNISWMLTRMGKDQEFLEASRTGNLQVVERLLSPKAKSTTRSLVASFGIKVGPNVNCQDQSGYTPLHHSALNGHEPVVRYLLQNSASANVNDLKGNFPLHLAAWSGNADIVKCLLTHGPSVARVNEQNGDKETSLHCAAQHGHTETVKVLLQNAADPLVRNIRDESPLDLASQYGRMDVVRLLLQFQPSLLSQSPECFTPLHLASRNGHKEVVEMLLAHGADINRTGENGSALHEAALFGKPDVVRLLLSRGANPHTLDPKNRTPMELVRQLNTQTSREISQLILSRLQDGEDYEPLSPEPNDTTHIPASLMHTFMQAPATPESPHTYIDMHKAFLERNHSQTNVFESSTHSIASIPRVTVEEHYIAPGAQNPPEIAPPSLGNESLTPKGFGSWGRSSIGKGIMLRRSASARSSKSLPRLPSSRSRSPSGSFLVADANVSHLRQHHPSSNMFPVSPTQHKQLQQKWDRIKRSSSSLPSSPHLSLSLPTSPSRLKEPKEQTADEKTVAQPRKNFTRERLKTEDDSVFLPAHARGLSSFARTRRINSFDHHVAQPSKSVSDIGKIAEPKLAYQSTHAQSTTALMQRQSVDSEFGTPNKSPPGSRPKKPVRTSKLSSIMTPPPIPPKPMSMIRSPKVRPPSPKNPPPNEGEEEDEEEKVDDGKALGSSVVENLITENRVSGGVNGTADEPTYDNIRMDFTNFLAPSTGQGPQNRFTTGEQHVASGSTTPAFSPPSPHTAMIEVSETLRKAISHESLLERLTNQVESSRTEWPEMSYVDESSHSVSSYHSSSDEEKEDGKKPKEDRNHHPSTDQPLAMQPRPDQIKALSNPSDENNEHQPMQSNHSKPNSVSPFSEITTVQNAVTAVCSSPPKPAKRSKPPVANKPQYKSPKPDIPPRRTPVVTPPTITPRKTVRERSKVPETDDNETVQDSKSYFITGSAQVKQARIRSTRSSESHPTSPSSTPGKENPVHFGGFDSPGSGTRFSGEARNVTATQQSDSAMEVDAGTQPSAPITLCSALSALTTPQCWPLAKDADDPPDNHVTDPEIGQTQPEASRPPGFVGLRRLSRNEHDSMESLATDGTRSTADEWDDAVSVRTEDFEMPKEVRKFRGLIRGASYKSRSKHCYGTTTASHHKSTSDSDGYGAEFDDDISEGSVSRVTPAIVRDHVPTSRGGPMTLDGLSKRQNPGNLDLALDPPHYSTPGRREMRRKYTPGRSDGDDSPLSSSPSSLDEFDGRLMKETSTPRVSKPRASVNDSTVAYADHKRSNSFYDNNNNSSNSSKSKESPVKLESPGDRLPDLATIVDTVTAVRSRSSQGSSSDPASGSSASSTLAKSVPMVQADVKEEGEPGSENDEWAQIASIMSSIGGGLNKGPVYAKEFEETFWKIMTGSELPRQVSTWLQELGLPQYETVLSGNGFDDVDFLAGDILEERDLTDMDIRDSSHRRRLLESAKNLPRLHPLAPPDNPSAPSSVVEWLASIHLQQYEAAFVSKGFGSMKSVRSMTEADIKPLVSKRGHFKRVRSSLFGRLKDDKKPASNQSTRSRSNSQVKASPPLSRSPLLDSANFFKDYTNIVKSRGTTLSSTRSNDNASPAFPSGTVSSTSSAGSGKPSGLPTERVPTQGDPSATETPARGRKSSKTATAPADNDEQAQRSRHRHRKSSRDSGRSKPRSRSGSHSSKTRRTELSVFVDKSAKGQHARQNSSSGTRSSHHRQRSHHKSSSSLKSVNSEQKENLRMSKPGNSTDIPDVERAIFLASESSSGEALNLRPPNETTREVSVHAWRHQADTLITGCCNYQAYYLGSMLIHELKGVESTVEACAKMRKSTDSMKKIPTIVLAINYTGVKFIDSKSQHEIAEHEICNISFASQDSEDLATFAYITHDVRTGHHYCHVFRVTTMDMAYEIILTLGQAFEVAYQLILKDKAIKEREVR